MISISFLRKYAKPRVASLRYTALDEPLKAVTKEAATAGMRYLLIMEKNAPTGVVDLDNVFKRVDEIDQLRFGDLISKDFCILNESNLNLLVYQDTTTQYVVIYSEGKYIGLLDMGYVDYYSSLLNDTVEILGQILDSTYNGIIAVDQERNIIILNQKAAETYGIEVADMVDKPVYEVISKSPLNNFIFDGGMWIGHKCKIQSRYIMANRTPLILNDNYIGGISVFQDITEDELASQELTLVKENELYLESIIDNSYDGIYITDSDGLILKVNSSYERITGISKDRLIGKYMQDLVNEGLLSMHLTDRVVAEKKPITLNQTANNKKLIITGSPLFDKNGNVSKVITNVRDITELLSLERQLSISQEMANIYKKELFDKVSDNIICDSEKMKQVFYAAEKVAMKDSTILILGETGVGKEVVAKYIHTHSDRSNKNYIKINCGAIPANLLESEIFGYVGGAFTGANPKGKMGVFELASEGTLFLDEIGELPMHLQAALLRVLQDGEVTRVGDTKSKKVNVRIIAATNQNLEKMIEEGNFRSDLFYRLNVVSIYVSPLRERKEDIAGLAEHFVSELNKKYNGKKIITSTFIDSLQQMDWPGNVRELSNFIEKQYVFSELDILDTFITGHTERRKAETASEDIIVKGLVPLNYAVKKVESILIKRTMEQVNNTYKAAKILDISQSTFFRKYKEYCTSRDSIE
jgi:PAS domain S-box-containing protein